MNYTEHLFLPSFMGMANFLEAGCLYGATLVSFLLTQLAHQLVLKLMGAIILLFHMMLIRFLLLGARTTFWVILLLLFGFLVPLIAGTRLGTGLVLLSGFLYLALLAMLVAPQRAIFMLLPAPT